MTGLELAANYYETRAHWSADLAPEHVGLVGRRGTALCITGGSRVVVFDQQYMDRKHAVWETSPKDHSALPLCKHCERARAKLEASRG